jgi:ubiquinone biosynthesis monooxygenase Coq7
MPSLEIDRLIIALDNGLRTLFARAHSARPVPGDDVAEAELSAAERELTAALMRINHSGEICAQALYQGQALTARDAEARAALERAAAEETDHLAWTAQRIEELGGRKSLFDPLWYAGSFAIGVATGLLGDRWNLGFLAETERQVEGHLEGHLERLPPQDGRSRAILDQMKDDEARHARTAVEHGAAELPAPFKLAMKLGSRVMTRTAFWL